MFHRHPAFVGFGPENQGFLSLYHCLAGFLLLFFFKLDIMDFDHFVLRVYGFKFQTQTRLGSFGVLLSLPPSRVL